TAEGVVIGSPAYMAPEQRRGQATTPRTDVHALALVACEMVTGKPPDPRGGLEGVPVQWRPPLRRALAVEPARRPRAPGEVGALRGPGSGAGPRGWAAVLLARGGLAGSGLLARQFPMRQGGAPLSVVRLPCFRWTTWEARRRTITSARASRRTS